jgi:hypothetical protein
MGDSTMHTTAELRWFFPGCIPDAVATWFDACDPDSEPSRTDIYLHPTSEAMNVKWRAGKVEAKRRDAEVEAIELGKGIKGVVEQWRKWSFTLSEGSERVEHPLWRPVRKERRMKSYRLDVSGRVFPVPEGVTPKSGCEVELSQIEIDDMLWWSLCFEAFGEETHLRVGLLQTVGVVFSEGFPLQLGIQQSYGYAAWLLDNAA